MSAKPYSCVGLVVCLALACRSGGPEQAPGPSEEAVRRNVLGNALMGQHEWARAEAEYRKGLESSPTDPILLTNLAVALVQQGRNDEAEPLLKQAIAVDPDQPHAHYSLGLIEKNRASFAQAAEHFGVVRAQDPDDVPTLYNLGAALARLGREDEASEMFQAALERDPRHVSTLYGLGRLRIQQGRRDEGITLVEESQRVRAQSGLDEAMGTQYGEQGRYAMAADYPTGGLSAPDPIPVRFVVAQRVGAGSAGAVSGTRPIRSLASGDVNGDGSLDLVALSESGEGITVAVLPGGTDDTWRRAVHSENTDHVVASKVVSADASLVDLDHDGDLDFFWCRSAAFIGTSARTTCRIGINDGSGAFQTREDRGGVMLDGVESTLDTAFTDFDNDRDVDLLVAEAGGVHVYSNQRDGTFLDVSEKFGLGAKLAGAESIAVADLDKDGFMDLAVATTSGVRLSFNRRGRFDAPQVLGGDAAGGKGLPLARSGVIAFDADNDGFLDLAAGGPGRPLTVHRNQGGGVWNAVPAMVEHAGLSVGTRPAAALDADGDGDLDLVAVEPGGSTVLLANEGGNAHRWLDVRLAGVRDSRHGVGAKVEVMAGALRQKFEVTEPLPVHMGLGSRKGADAVRVLWPGGVLQDELDLTGKTSLEVKQLDRKGTSCPLLYVRRDRAWRFVTDFLGGCAIGYQHAPGVLSVPDTDEYVKVEGGLTEEDGLYRLRLHNQLEEVIFFDAAHLVVVDHPEGTEVFPDERLMPGPPWPEFRLFASSDLRAIRGTDVGGRRDVSDLLRERDRRWVLGFELLPFKGYASPHTLELDLGPLPKGRRVVLLLDGWIDYADSTSNLAATQAGVSLTPPVLEVPDGRGGWKELRGVMGFPAGLPKTMAVELTGRVSRADPRLRLTTNMRIYWDRARLLVGGEDVPLRTRRLPPQRAGLRFGGFPEETSPDGKPPFAYDPARVSLHSPWKSHAGFYTGFGDVRARLLAVDDRFVTTRSGDEIELAFPAAPAPGPGLTRTFLLYADGFGKDMDPNSLAHDAVGPIPFHGMPLYPYGPDAAPPAALLESHAGDRFVSPADDGLPGATPIAIRIEDRR